MTPDQKPTPKPDDPRREEREPRERTAAPPLEREHETQEGALEEAERRKRERP